MQQRIRRFSRILKLRENDRTTEQIILAEERSEENEVLDRLCALEGEKSKALEKFCGSREKAFSRAELWNQRQVIEGLDDYIQVGKESLNEVRQRIACTENRLVERHRDVRVMEVYVDDLKADAFKSSIESEQIDLDVIAMLRYSRMRREQCHGA